MEPDFGNQRDGSEDQFLDAGLSGSRHGDGISVAAQARGEPEDVHYLNGLMHQCAV